MHSPKHRNALSYYLNKSCTKYKIVGDPNRDLVVSGIQAVRTCKMDSPMDRSARSIIKSSLVVALEPLGIFELG